VHYLSQSALVTKEKHPNKWDKAQHGASCVSQLGAPGRNIISKTDIQYRGRVCAKNSPSAFWRRSRDEISLLIDHQNIQRRLNLREQGNACAKRVTAAAFLTSVYYFLPYDGLNKIGKYV